MKKIKIIERLDYSNSEDILDIELHKRRYELASLYCSGGNILEIGCGMGFGTKLLAKKLSRSKIVAIDIDKVSIDYAKKHNSSKNITYKLMDATNLEFEDKTFDNVVTIENIEHVRDDKKYIYEIHRVLKDGGKLFLTTPNLYRPENLKTALFHQRPKNHFHIREYSIAELKQILTNQGYKIIRQSGLYFHLLPSRYALVKKLLRIAKIHRFLINTSCIWFNDYIYIEAVKSYGTE